MSAPYYCPVFRGPDGRTYTVDDIVSRAAAHTGQPRDVFLACHVMVAIKDAGLSAALSRGTTPWPLPYRLADLTP